MSNIIAPGYIVRGIKCGVFVVLGMRSIDGEAGAQLKAVNPANHSQMAPGELWLPLTALLPLV